MFVKINSSKRRHPNEQCYCHDENISYRIVENYRSILNRTQSFISTWKLFEKNAKISFTSGTYQRKGTDALVLRLNQICLINPWYKYINVNKHLHAIVQHSQAHQVFEIVLLECNCLTNLNEYELAIVQCPCLEQRKSHCTFCRFMLTATEQSKQILKNIKQQTNNSFTSNFSDEEIIISDNFHHQSPSNRYQRTVDIRRKSTSISTTFHSSHGSSISQTFHDEIDDSSSMSILLSHENDRQPNSSLSQNAFESDEEVSVNSNYQNRPTQTKLCAILLPKSLLTEMKPAKPTVITSTNVTRGCQVNTLSYLIKTNENLSDSSSTSYLHSKFPFNEQLTTEENANHIKLSRKIQHQPLVNRHYEGHDVHIPTIQIEDEDFDDEQPKTSLFTLAPLKCINACETVDLDEPHTSIISVPMNNDTMARSIGTDEQDRVDHILPSMVNTYQSSFDHSICHKISSNNNCQNKTLESPRQSSRFYPLRNKYYRILSRKRRRYRNRKHTHGFLQRLYHRKKRKSTELVTSTKIQPITSSIQRQQSTIDLHLNISDTVPQFKSIDHMILARATKNSIVCQQMQTLINNPETLLEQVIESQLTFTCYHHSKSVCILLDNHKQSNHSRSSFLHYIYTSLSNTLKMFIRQSSVRITCMNLAFFNNSVCDIITMRRLRLIDTGRKTILLPSCEIPLRTSNDINIAINRLSTNMSFAHQIFIVNFSHEHSSASGSYFFLQLAPICSIRPTGLFTNLNSSTYSVLNLIRQFNNGQLFHQNIMKRYLMNDCSLNRLLKSYLISPQQTMTVITMKQK